MSHFIRNINVPPFRLPAVTTPAVHLPAVSRGQMAAGMMLIGSAAAAYRHRRAEMEALPSDPHAPRRVSNNTRIGSFHP